jgi:ubiquinone/menaquinone biosynthesis C-methylase UbiE
MDLERATAPPESASRSHNYLHGAATLEQARLARRTAATAAAFFLPHLRLGMRLLDCGCGVGSITVGLAAAVAPGEAVGVDIQPAQVERARALAAERGLTNVKFEVASAYELPYPDASFDAVFAHTLLLHLAEPARALLEMKRVLKPGGVVGIADPDHGAMLREPSMPLVDEAHHLLMRVVAHNGGDNYRARHHQRLLREAGFVRPAAGASLDTVGVWATPDETRQFAAWEADQLRQPATVELVTAQGWADTAKLDSMHAAMLAWGDEPDAMLAIIGVTAVGWVEGSATVSPDVCEAR